MTKRTTLLIDEHVICTSINEYEKNGWKWEYQEIVKCFLNYRKSTLPCPHHSMYDTELKRVYSGEHLAIALFVAPMGVFFHLAQDSRVYDLDIDRPWTRGEIVRK